jgi:hypothetical protein
MTDEQKVSLSDERLRYIAFAQKVCGDDIPTLGEAVDMAREILALREQFDRALEKLVSLQSPAQRPPFCVHEWKHEFSIAQFSDGWIPVVCTTCLKCKAHSIKEGE